MKVKVKSKIKPILKTKGGKTIPEELLNQTKVGDSLEVGAEYHPEHGVVTILLSSPEQSTALNLEPEKGELNNFVEAVKRVEEEYSNR